MPFQGVSKLVRKRFRELGLTISIGKLGPKNMITDVPGVLVGHDTLIQGDGDLKPGEGPIRTGITTILPHNQNLYKNPVVGTIHVINGFGKATGIAQIQEVGLIDSPISITSTMNVGKVYDALIEYITQQNPDAGISSHTPNPVVLECHDGYLNDSQGRHVHKKHVFRALNNSTDFVKEGCVGAGTGMMTFGYKSGIGTASRLLPEKHGSYLLGCLTVPNYGRRGDLIIRGQPIGKILLEQANGHHKQGDNISDGGSIVVVLATNAPLSSRQLTRIAKRAVIGIGNTGSIVSHGSGDFVIAFTTQTESSRLKDSQLTPFFAATIEAIEESIFNSLCMATPMIGRDNRRAPALPLDSVTKLLKKVH